MKTKQSRRKFIATTISGTMASIVTPMAFAGKLPEQTEANPSGMTGNYLSPNVADTMPKRVDLSEFIIFPWGGMPDTPESGRWGDLADMDAMMRDLYDCGFNTSGFTGVRNLKYARNNQLKVILSSGINTTTDTTQEKADEAIKTLMDSITDPDDRKAVYAIYLRDEPNASHFPQLNIWSEAVKKQRIMPYINLFPDYASSEQLGTKDYQEHLDKYVDICKPPYLSYDNYSLFEGQRLDEVRFYGNMESIRDKSLQAGIPFWNVILSNAHFKYAEPSDATLAIQVYSTLAYGGKGIGYFTYYAPQVGNYRLAPIDRFGYRTKTWAMMRNINLQIHSLVPYYNKLKSVNVFHADSIPKNGQGVASAKLIESVKGESLLVGEFTDAAGKPYAMVVNKNMHSSVSYDIQFKTQGRIMLISQYNRGIVPFQGEQKWLAPGCGVLLCVE